LKLRYTLTALAELDEVLTYLSERSPLGAQSVRQRLHTMIGFVATHPHAGTELKGRGLRRIAALPYPYLVFYRVEGDEVIVIGVRHAARDQSDLPSEA
jgi:plasmid stabilization system protein ParE